MTRRAILSVHDKTGLTELGNGLSELGFELVASGGTARHLREAGLTVVDVSTATGAAEILGGRVKTLHPAVHGGILARRTDDHLQELATHGYAPFDLVVCNLYPFRETVRNRAVGELDAIEQIDIGGVALLRAAAKNYESVTIVCDPEDYPAIVDGFAYGSPAAELRRRLALKAFRVTAAYDAAIATWLATRCQDETALPERITLVAERTAILRYGENPHQRAASYRWVGAEPRFEQLQGKAISYNNLVDLDAAWAMPNEFNTPAVAIVKHTNPCGLATASNAVEAFQAALECDPVSAFGSIITVNREVDLAFVQAVGRLFVEVIAAPSFTSEATEALGRRKKNCRVMVARIGPDTGYNPLQPTDLAIRSTTDGLLVQTNDDRGVDIAQWTIATERTPSDAERADLAFGWIACKHVKSNAIVLAKQGATIGIGAGQMNRVDSVRIAARQAGDKAQGGVLASDAFFPFADGIEAAAEAGVTAVIQPGGSIRDEEVIAAANRLGIAMVFTGDRHFKH